MPIHMQNKTIMKTINVNDNLLINPSIDLIRDHIVKNDEGVIAINNAAMVDTGIFTGRSPQDKYIVEEDSTKDNIWWGPVNRKIDSSVFDRLHNKVVDYYNSRSGRFKS